MQKICYMEPIQKAPTSNDVVREIMIRILNVAKESGQDYAVVTYDLAIALKAYSIQSLDAPLSDKLLIMLNNFHTELAFHGEVGTYINDSGSEFILSECDVLAEESMMGFIKGKFYNRCSRIHELLAITLEKKLHNRILADYSKEENHAIHSLMSSVPSDPSSAEEYLDTAVVHLNFKAYKEFFQAVLRGFLCATAQYWGIYIFLINRLHMELQRCVKSNDVKGYIQVLPAVLDIFFALNHPQCARWGSLFFLKLKNADSHLIEIQYYNRVHFPSDE